MKWQKGLSSRLGGQCLVVDGEKVMWRVRSKFLEFEVCCIFAWESERAAFDGRKSRSYRRRSVCKSGSEIYEVTNLLTLAARCLGGDYR